MRRDLLLAFGVVLLVGPLMQPWSAQPASRYLLTAAAVEHRTLELDAYDHLLGVDRAEYRGHTYSDKAPYQPLLGVPFLETWEAAGGSGFPGPVGELTAEGLVDDDNRALWWVTLWTVTVPAALLAVVVRRLVSRTHPPLAYPVAVAMAVGTTLLPFSSLLFAHVLAALLLTLAWFLVREPGPSSGAVLLAGVCLGFAIGTEYAVAVVAAVVLVAVLLADGFIKGVWLSVGTVLGTLPLLLYNWLVFENPLEVSYQGHLGSFEGEGALGVYNLELPKLDEMYRALLSDKGLFVLTPVMLLAMGGCVLAIAEASRIRRDAVVALVSFGLLLLVTSGVDGLGGSTPGPRYLIPVLPLFAIPLAEVWSRYPRLCIGATVFGFVWMWLATVTDALANQPQDWLRDLGDGDLVANVVTGHQHVSLALLSAAAGLALLALALRPPAKALG